MTERTHQPASKELRTFALVVAGGFLVVGALSFYRTRFQPTHVTAWVCWILTALIAIAGLVAPSRLDPIFRVWVKVGHVLGWINTRIILAVTFYGLWLPFGIVSRLAGRDPLQLGRRRHTYWVPKKPPVEPPTRTYRRMF